MEWLRARIWDDRVLAVTPPEQGMATRQAFIDGSERCYMKLLVDAQTDKVLAVHMLGADAPEIVQSLAVALTAGATKAQFDRTIAVHPTAAEEFVLMREASRTVG